MKALFDQLRDSVGEQTNSDSLKTYGIAHIPRTLDSGMLLRLQNSLSGAQQTYAEAHTRFGYVGENDGGLHHVLSLGGAFLDLLAALPAYALIGSHFAGKFIVNSYGAVCTEPSKKYYTYNIHRDVRFFTDELPVMLNVIVFLSDFTEENGATYLLPKSHRIRDRPSDDYFYENAVRAIGSAGDVVLFNSNIWHAGGVNNSNASRSALTITLTRPYMKQQFDYAGAFNPDVLEQLSEQQLQLLGYFSRTPKTLEEWYQPAEKRMYRAGQG